MKMLRWMYGNRKDRTKNKVIHKKVELAPIDDKLREGWLGLFRCVKRKLRVA